MARPRREGATEESWPARDSSSQDIIQELGVVDWGGSGEGVSPEFGPFEHPSLDVRLVSNGSTCND